jgi:hypothetical protein
LEKKYEMGAEKRKLKEKERNRKINENLKLWEK